MVADRPAMNSCEVSSSSGHMFPTVHTAQGLQYEVFLIGSPKFVFITFPSVEYFLFFSENEITCRSVEGRTRTVEP